MRIYLKPLLTVNQLFCFYRSRTVQTVKTLQFLAYNGLASELRCSGQPLLALCGVRACNGDGARGVHSEPRLQGPRMMQHSESC